MQEVGARDDHPRRIVDAANGQWLMKLVGFFYLDARRCCDNRRREELLHESRKTHPGGALSEHALALSIEGAAARHDSACAH